MGAKLPLNLLPPLTGRNARAVHDAVDQFLRLAHLLALQDCRDRTRQTMPLLFVLSGSLPAFSGQRVILAFPAVIGSAPFGLDLSFFFQQMQRGVQSALFELECIGAA